MQTQNFLKYAVVIEFQKRGAIHFHVLFFNLPYIDQNILAKLWGKGFIKINKIDNVKNIGSYVTKYMSKDFGDSRLCGQKSYFTSRGLKKPFITYDESAINILLNAMPDKDKAFQIEFDSKFSGKSKFIQFNLKDYPELKNVIKELLENES
jgi:hypothetical protein